MTKEFSLSERHEWWGRWWTPAKPDHSFGGMAVYDPAQGISLRVVGGFDHLVFDEPSPGVRSFSGATRTFPVLFGLADGSEITLIDSVVSKSRGGLWEDSAYDQTLTAMALVHGAHIEDPSAPIVRAVELTVQNLPIWSGVTAIRGKTIHPSKDSGKKPSAKVRVGAVPRNEAHASGDRYILNFAYGLPTLETTATRHEVLLHDEPSLRVEFNEPRAIMDALRTPGRLQDLLTLSMSTPCAIVRQTVVLPARDGEYPDTHPLAGRDRAVQCLTRQAPAQTPAPRAVAHHELVFTLADVPFADLIPRWVEAASRFEAATTMVLGLLYQQNQYLENRTITAVAAAESFHRALPPEPPMTDAQFKELRRALMDAAPPELRGYVGERFRRNEPSLKARLLALVSRLDPEIAAKAVADPETWAKHARDARNLLAHEGKRLKGDIELLFAVTEVTSAVVILNLLQELGVPREKVLEKFDENQMLMRAARLSRKHLVADGEQGAS